MRSGRSRLWLGSISMLAAAVLLMVHLAGAPLRDARRAFVQLAAVDAAGISGPQGVRATLAFQMDTELVTMLARVLPAVATDNVGYWVLTGRLVKYAAALGTPPSELVEGLTAVRGEYPPPRASPEVGRAFGALERISIRYASSRALRRRAVSQLASLLGAQDDENTVIAAVNSRYCDIVAQDIAVQAARAAERARHPAARPAIGPTQLIVRPRASGRAERWRCGGRHHH